MNTFSSFRTVFLNNLYDSSSFSLAISLKYQIDVLILFYNNINIINFNLITGILKFKNINSKVNSVNKLTYIFLRLILLKFLQKALMKSNLSVLHKPLKNKLIKKYNLTFLNFFKNYIFMVFSNNFFFSNFVIFFQ